jgi:hypothetical protein
MLSVNRVFLTSTDLKQFEKREEEIGDILEVAIVEFTTLKLGSFDIKPNQCKALIRPFLIKKYLNDGQLSKV